LPTFYQLDVRCKPAVIHLPVRFAELCLMTPDYVDAVLRLGTIGAVALIVLFGSAVIALAMLL